MKDMKRLLPHASLLLALLLAPCATAWGFYADQNALGFEFLNHGLHGTWNLAGEEHTAFPVLPWYPVEQWEINECRSGLSSMKYPDQDASIPDPLPAAFIVGDTYSLLAKRTPNAQRATYEIGWYLQVRKDQPAFNVTLTVQTSRGVRTDLNFTGGGCPNRQVSPAHACAGYIIFEHPCANSSLDTPQCQDLPESQCEALCDALRPTETIEHVGIRWFPAAGGADRGRFWAEVKHE